MHSRMYIMLFQKIYCRKHETDINKLYAIYRILKIDTEVQ
jgi:hypothetical protein